MKEYRYDLDFVDQKAVDSCKTTVQIQKFLTTLHRSLQALFETLSYESVQHVQNYC